MQKYMHMWLTLLYCYLGDKHLKLVIAHHLYSQNNKIVTEADHIAYRKTIRTH